MGKCSSPTLPQIPDIVVGGQSRFIRDWHVNEPQPEGGSLRTLTNKQRACRRFFEAQQKQQHQQQVGAGGGSGSDFSDEDCTKRMIVKPKNQISYGSLKNNFYKNNNNNNSEPSKNKGTQANSFHNKSVKANKPGLGYYQNRIHRTSSLNRIAHLDSVSSDTGLSSDSISYGKTGDKTGGGGADGHHEDKRPVGAISDIIGSFGLFQMIVLLFSGLREGLVGYDALIMSIILQPETKFLCADNFPANFQQPSSTVSSHIRATSGVNASSSSSSGGGGQDSFEQSLKFENKFYNNNLTYGDGSNWNKTTQCYRSPDGGRTLLLDHQTGQPVPCQKWIFSNETLALETGPSLVAEWSLVCQYNWLVAFIESAYFFGLVAGNLTWGYYADKLGRRPAYLMAHTMSLIFGSLAVVMPSVYLFTLCRFLSAFGSIGYNIIYSIQVELIGAKHRSFSTTLNHLGWGLGVICIPLVDHLFDDYRPLIALAPVLTLFMYPWAFWLPESPRWLMANGHYEQARKELIRAARYNGKPITPQLDKDIFALEQKIRAGELEQKVARDNIHTEEKRSYHLIFTTPKLMRDTVILAYLAFLGHLYYYVQTINFAYMKNLSTEANFITSGAGEWVSVIIGAVLLKFFTRKTCMSLFLFIMACSFAFQSLIDSEWFPNLETTLIITTNNGFGTLSSLLLVFVVLIVNQEVYPTVVRQTGRSITNTVGESGSTLAPILIQFSRIIGPSKANGIYTVFCSLGILAVQFVTKTDDIELPDT